MSKYFFHQVGPHFIPLQSSKINQRKVAQPSQSGWWICSGCVTQLSVIHTCRYSALLSYKHNPNHRRQANSCPVTEGIGSTKGKTAYTQSTTPAWREAGHGQLTVGCLTNQRSTQANPCHCQMGFVRGEGSVINHLQRVWTIDQTSAPQEGASVAPLLTSYPDLYSVFTKYIS